MNGTMDFDREAHAIKRRIVDSEDNVDADKLAAELFKMQKYIFTIAEKLDMPRSY